MSDDPDKVWPTGLTEKEAEEVHSYLIDGTRVFGVIALIANAPVALSGHCRDGAGAARRHAQPGDDRRAVRVGDARRRDDLPPLLFVPFRALIGKKSDTHRSAPGWRRVP